MPTAYPTEFKIKTIRRYEKGASIKALSQELHIAQSTLYQWRNTYCSIQTPDRIYTPSRHLIVYTLQPSLTLFPAGCKN